MRVHFEITHPAHVHMFKYAIRDLADRGHETLVTTRDKEITIELLKHYDIPYQVLSRQGRGVVGLARELMIRDMRLLKAARRFGSEVIVGVHAVFAAHVSRLLRIPSIVFDDLENQRLSHLLTNRCASHILTPQSYRLDLGAKQIRYPGYHQLTHLHPNRFRPDPAVLADVGLAPDEPFFVVRLVGWAASHDIGKRGISSARLNEFVESLAACGRVFITSERELPTAFQKYRIPIATHRLHQLMYYARLYFGESSTTGAEAAVLGTPTVVCNSLDHGFLHELADKYGLVHYTEDQTDAMKVTLSWASDDDLKKKQAERRQRMLKDKIDVTEWLVALLEAVGQGKRDLGEVRFPEPITN